MRVWTMVWALLMVVITGLECLALWVHLPFEVWTYALIGLLGCSVFAIVLTKFTSLSVPS